MNIEKKEQIQEIKSTAELSKLAEQILANYPADDHAYITYGESADLIENQASDMQQTIDAEWLRAIEARWFELEG